MDGASGVLSHRLAHRRQPSLVKLISDQHLFVALHCMPHLFDLFSTPSHPCGAETRRLQSLSYPSASVEMDAVAFFFQPVTVEPPHSSWRHLQHPGEPPHLSPPFPSRFRCELCDPDGFCRSLPMVAGEMLGGGNLMLYLRAWLAKRCYIEARAHLIL